MLIAKIHTHFKFSWAKWLITILTIYHLPWLCKNYYVTRFSLHSKSKSMYLGIWNSVHGVHMYLLKLGFLQTAQTKKNLQGMLPHLPSVCQNCSLHLVVVTCWEIPHLSKNDYRNPRHAYVRTLPNCRYDSRKIGHRLQVCFGQSKWRRSFKAWIS